MSLNVTAASLPSPPGLPGFRKMEGAQEWGPLVAPSSQPWLAVHPSAKLGRKLWADSSQPLFRLILATILQEGFSLVSTSLLI